MGKFKALSGDYTIEQKQDVKEITCKTIVLKPDPIYSDGFWASSFSVILHSMYRVGPLTHKNVTDATWEWEPGADFKVGDLIALEVVLQDDREIHHHVVQTVEQQSSQNMITLSNELVNV